jgi:flagellar protein FliJ
MKKYKFRLQRILEVRKHIEEEKKGVLATEQTELQRRHDLKNTLEDAQKKILLEQAEQQKGLLDIEAIGRYHSFNNMLKTAIKQAGTSIENQVQNVKGATLILVEASRDKKVLENLNEKDRFKYLKELDKAEGQELDEMGLQQFHRSKGSVS